MTYPRKAVIHVDNQEKLLTSVERLQSDLDSLRQEIKSQIANKSNDDFKITVKRVDKKNDQAPGSARLEGDIETI